MPCHAILHYTTLHYTTLHYTTLHYTILYYTILYHTILYYTTLHYTILYYTILYYTILYYTTPCDVILNYTTVIRCKRKWDEIIKTLYIEIIQSILILVDTPDPYVKLRVATCPNSLQRTKCIPDEKNPKWNNEFKFFLDPDLKEEKELGKNSKRLILLLLSFEVAYHIKHFMQKPFLMSSIQNCSNM